MKLTLIGLKAWIALVIALMIAIIFLVLLVILAFKAPRGARPVNRKVREDLRRIKEQIEKD